MSLNIGTLVGYLQLDDSNFNRKADAADKRMSALQLELKAIGRLHPKVQIEVDAQTAYLDDLKARLADLKRQAAEGVDVRVDTVATLMRLDEVRARIREIKASAMAPAPLDVDTADAEAKLTFLGMRIDWLNSKLNGLGKVKGPGLLWTALLGFGPMLAAIGGAATAAFGAFTSGALSAVAGIGVLKLALKDIGPGAAAYKAYQQSLTKADQSYSTAVSRATSAHSAALGRAFTAAQVRGANSSYTQAQRSAAQSLAQARSNAQTTLDQSAYGSLSPQARAFVQFDIAKLQPTGTGFKQAAENSVLPGLQHGLAHAIQAAPVANAAISRIGNAVGEMALKAGKALNDPFWRRWIDWLGHSAAHDIPLLGSAVGHMVEGIARAIKKFSPDGHSMLDWVNRLAKHFDHWTTTNGFTKFLDSVRKDGSVVSSTLGSLWKILGPFLSGAASAGFAEWKVFGQILSGLAMLPSGFFKVLGASLPIIVLGLKGMQIVNAVAVGIRAMGVAMGFLNAAMDANVISVVILAIAALAAGLVYAYNHSKTFRDIVNACFKAVGDAASFMWNNVLKPVFKLWLDMWLTVVGAIVQGAATAFGWIPGLGPKLKAAAGMLRDFKNQVDAIFGDNKQPQVVPNATIADHYIQTAHASNSKTLHHLYGAPPKGGNAALTDPTLGGLVAPRSGIVFTGPTNIQAHDYNDFQRQIQRRHQMLALGGYGAN